MVALSCAPEYRYITAISFPARNINPDRAMKETLQHQATTPCIGLPPPATEAIFPMDSRPVMHIQIKPEHSGGSNHPCPVFSRKVDVASKFSSAQLTATINRLPLA